jgi:hypothetical protein
MDTIRKLAQNPWVMLAVGLVVGLFFGLVVLGWWLFPVQWTDAEPADLRYDAKVEYLRKCIDAFGYNGDAAGAKFCYDSLGPEAAQALTDIVQNPVTQDPKLVAAFGTVVLADTAALAVITPGVEGQATLPPATLPAAEEPAAETAQGGVPSWLVVSCVLGLLGIAVVALIFFLRSGRLNLPGSGAKSSETARQAEDEPVTMDYAPVPSETPIIRSMASYQLGDDLFDEIYPIELDGDFLGEFGVAIADSAGVGGPKKVTAFEVWLFDKKNIPTTTKVLMSAATYGDDNKRQRLEAKGEPILAEPGMQTVLQTKTLTLVAKLVDMKYGDSAMPAESYFDRFVLELAVWQTE